MMIKKVREKVNEMRQEGKITDGQLCLALATEHFI